MSLIQRLTRDFSAALMRVDAAGPVAVSATTKRAYRAGIGPHTETATLRLVREALSRNLAYRNLRSDIPYASVPRQRCDWLLGDDEYGDVFIEAKMMRLMGDNGKPNDNILTHILSPYPQQRSALTDCEKLVRSGFQGRFVILIYGYEYPSFPLEPVMEEFEILAAKRVRVLERASASFENLIHPIHQMGATFGWEIADNRTIPGVRELIAEI
jgi:hypothetical protein